MTGHGVDVQRGGTEEDGQHWLAAVCAVREHRRRGTDLKEISEISGGC